MNDFRACDSFLCNHCSDPGHCCRGFRLFGKEIDLPTKLDAMVEMAYRFLPFIPDYSVEKKLPNDLGWWFTCPSLLENGRCGDYENRPDTCRNFAAGSADLCVEFRGDING